MKVHPLRVHFFNFMDNQSFVDENKIKNIGIYPNERDHPMDEKYEIEDDDWDKDTTLELENQVGEIPGYFSGNVARNFKNKGL